MMRRAYVTLGQLVHSYVHLDAAHGTGEPALSIPRQLGLPWHQACTGLGLPHILVAAGVDMWNFEKVDPEAGYSIDNLKTVTSMTGTVAAG